MHRSQPFTRLPPALFLIPAMALVAILPLILRGCSCGHDFDFHLLSWFEAAAQFRAGNLHPDWAFSPAFNAGEPRFVFYPPISWTVGAILGILFPWTLVPVVYTWIALTASGAAMYRLARHFSGANASLVAAALYIANPYMLFTAYERTAYAELLAAAWLPLLLDAALRPRISSLRIAFPVALLWLTNAPAAVMGCYALALIALVRLVRTPFFPNQLAVPEDSIPNALKARATLALRFAAGAALGLALAAFYIIPAAWERRWVQIAMATISGMRITDNFLFHHTADPLHDQVLQTASIIAVILLATAVVAFGGAMLRARDSHRRDCLVPLAILSTAIAIMLTPVSAPIWRLAPEMQFLQFPWRLLAVLAPAICAAIAIATDRSPNQGSGPDQVPAAPSIRGLFANAWVLTAATLCLVAAITLPSVRIFRQFCDDEDNVAARLALFNAKTGTDPTDEYTPDDADNDSLAHSDPAFWLTADQNAAAPGAGTPGTVPMHFSTVAPEDETLVLNLRDYPAWQVKINGSVAARAETRNDGLIAVSVHQGAVQVDIAYAAGRDHALGDTLSALALAAALALGLTRRRSHA